MTETEPNQAIISEKLSGPVVHTIIEFSDSGEILSGKTERIKRKPIGRRYKQIAITTLQLNEDGTGPKYENRADPGLIEAVYSDELEGLTPQERIEKIKHLKNPAYQATYRLSKRLKRLATEQNSDDQNAKNFIDELRAIHPLYKNLGIYKLIALITRGSQADFLAILSNPEEREVGDKRRGRIIGKEGNVSRQIGNRQRDLVLKLLERTDENGFTYDYYGDKKMLEAVWKNKAATTTPTNQQASSERIRILRTRAHDRIVNFVTRLRKGDVNVLKFLEEYRENNPYYEYVGDEELIAILERKRTMPIYIKRVYLGKRRKGKSVEKKSSEKSSSREKSVSNKSSSKEKSKKRPNKRKPISSVTKQTGPKKIPTRKKVPKPELTTKTAPNTPINRDSKSPFLNHLIDVRDGIERY